MNPVDLPDDAEVEAVAGESERMLALVSPLLRAGLAGGLSARVRQQRAALGQLANLRRDQATARARFTEILDARYFAQKFFSEPV